jgi:hypothetical protein
MPVLANYFASHQWLRELKRRGARPLVGVYFRVPDRERVLVGHFRMPHAFVSAAQAAKVIMAAPDPRGYQVIVPRGIAAKEIHDIREVNRVVGWRYYPEAKGRKPCPCPYCIKGDKGARKIREKNE